MRSSRPEIATLPISDADTATIDSSSTGRQRFSTPGGAKPNSQSVIVGRSISRNSARNVSVTSDSSEPNAPPAKPRIVLAASGTFDTTSCSVECTELWVPLDTTFWNAALLVSSFQYVGSSCANATSSFHKGLTVTRTIAASAAKITTKTNTAARPRPQPRLTSAPTTGSRPRARTAATRIDSSVPSDRIISATTAPNASSTSSVRTGTTISTRGAG